jgi:hypothetical protein
MPRKLLVYGEKTFRITVPDDAKITFGPWAPPSKGPRSYEDSGRTMGTLRIYRGTKDNIIGCFSPVKGFRDLDLGYEEQVAVEEGSTIWKSDNDGYKREEQRRRQEKWVNPDRQLTAGPVVASTKRTKKR